MTVLGVDIGGTKIAVGLVRPDGTVLATASTPTPATEGAHAGRSINLDRLPWGPPPAVCGTLTHERLRLETCPELS